VGGWEAEEDGERGSEAERAREGDWGSREGEREREREARGSFYGNRTLQDHIFEVR
jgi:hypothetical protein